MELQTGFFSPIKKDLCCKETTPSLNNKMVLSKWPIKSVSPGDTKPQSSFPKFLEDIFSIQEMYFHQLFAVIPWLHRAFCFHNLPYSLPYNSWQNTCYQAGFLQKAQGKPKENKQVNHHSKKCLLLSSVTCLRYIVAPFSASV